MKQPSPQPVPRCPRCGYDQSGSVAAWNELCPLEGTCPECGLRFEWAEIYHPLLRAPRWSFEHAEKRPARAMVVTLVRNTLVAGFFRRISMAFPLRGHRLARYVLLGLACAYLALVSNGVAGAFQGIVIGAGTSRVLFPPNAAWQWTPWRAAGVERAPPAVGRGRSMPDYHAWIAPISQSDAMALWCVASLGYAVWPFSDHAAARFTGVVSPRYLRATRGMPAFIVTASVAMTAAVAIVTSATLLLLAQTFRRVAVRRSHIWRGVAYGLAPLMLVTAAVSVLTGLTRIVGWMVWPNSPLLARVLNHLESGATFGIPPALLWFACFWLAFIRTYLKLPHAWAVWLLTLVLGYLAATIAVGLGFAATVLLARVMGLAW